MANLDYLSHQTLVDSAGAPYVGAKIYYYETGTTTLKATYSDAGLTSANTNPVVTDANGVVPEVYLTAGRYKRTVKTSADVSLSQFDADPIDASVEMITAASAPATTYPFLIYYNTSDGHRYRRNAANSSWIDEGLIDNLVNAASVTDVLTGTDTSKAVTPDALAAIWQRGTDIASASSLSLPSTGGNVFNITGTTTITGISTAQGGRTLKLRFAGALTLTHNGTSFILPGEANITTVAGDTAEFINEASSDASGSNWRCFDYQRGSGSPVNLTDFTATQSEQEAGTSTTKFVTAGRQHYHDSAAKAWTTGEYAGGAPNSPGADSYNVSSVSDTAAGVITVNFTTAFSSANYAQSGMCQRGATNNALWPAIRRTTNPTTSACAVAFVSDGATDTDPGFYSVVFHGDQ